MVYSTILEAAAAQASGTNIVTGSGGDSRIQTSPNHRYIEKLAVVGSSAAGNASVKLYFGLRYIGQFYNTTSGAVVGKEAGDFQHLGIDAGVIQPGEQLIVETGVVSATNKLTVTLDIRELPV
jgi:hypothetical protein